MAKTLADGGVRGGVDTNVEPMVSVERLSSSSRTLLLPLFYRAVESSRPDPILSDAIASELIRHINFDFAEMCGRDFDRAVAMLRAAAFDRIVREFLGGHSHPVVIDIGCGLDTRFFRVDDGKVRWYDLDVPAVAEIRRALIPARDRCSLLATAAEDVDWITSIQAEPSACLFIAEGVLMYMEEQSVKRLVMALAERFPGAEFAFDAISPALARSARFTSLNPATRRATALLRWLPRDVRILESWDVRMHFRAALRYLDRHERRAGPMRWLFSLPPLGTGSRIVRYAVSDGFDALSAPSGAMESMGHVG